MEVKEARQMSLDEELSRRQKLGKIASDPNAPEKDRLFAQLWLDGKLRETEPGLFFHQESNTTFQTPSYSGKAGPDTPRIDYDEPAYPLDPKPKYQGVVYEPLSEWDRDKDGKEE